MDVRSYKGYQICAVPHQLTDAGDWTINIQISHDQEDKIRWMQFSTANCCKTREQAVAHCFDFGTQIIDDKLQNFAVDGL